jgi:hypothetical protein
MSVDVLILAAPVDTSLCSSSPNVAPLPKIEQIQYHFIAPAFPTR